MIEAYYESKDTEYVCEDIRIGGHGPVQWLLYWLHCRVPAAALGPGSLTDCVIVTARPGWPDTAVSLTVNSWELLPETNSKLAQSLITLGAEASARDGMIGFPRAAFLYQGWGGEP